MVDYIFKWVGRKRVWYRPFIKSWGITFKALSIVAILIILKFFIDLYELNFIPMSALITAFISGVFFTISILFAGAMADFKESEKIPGEITVSIKTLYKDSQIVPLKDKKIIFHLQKNILHLLSVINDNLRRNVWKLKEIDVAIDKIDDDLKQLSENGVPPNYVLKMRTELSVIDRYSHRADVITETTFIPAAYALAEIAISTLVFILLFIKMDNQIAGMIILGAISLVLTSLVFLIRDMDSPFEVNTKSYADVDLSILFNLEEYLKNKIKEEEKKGFD